MISRRCALLGLLGAIMASPGMAAATEIAASQGGAIALTAAPTRVALRPAANVDIATALADAGSRQFVLVVRGLAADKPPATAYLIFLNLSEGATLSPDDASYAGSISFFDVHPASEDTDAQAISFVVSDVLQRLRAAGRLAGVTVTLAPTVTLAADSHPTINRITLFAQ
jgi:hypothetical protein